MPLRAPAYLLAFTHAAALSGGFMLYRQSHPSIQSAPEATGPRPHAITTAATARSPEQILKDLTPALTGRQAALAAREKKLAAAREAIRNLRAPDKIESAVTSEYYAWRAASKVDSSAFSPRLAALLYHWLLTDPAACNDWQHHYPRIMDGDFSPLEAATLEVAKQPGGIDAILKSPPLYIEYSLGRWLGADPDLQLIAQFQSRLKPEERASFCSCLALRWPVNRRQEMITFALQQNRPNMLLHALHLPGESSRWLIDLYESPATPASFRDAMRQDPAFVRELAADPSIPVEQRLSYLPDMNESFRYRIIAKESIARAINDNGSDWGDLVHTGEATPQQALDAVSLAVPDLAAAAPDAVREEVFQWLVRRDPAQAATLLDHLPEPQRNGILSAALQTFDSTTSPDTTSPDAFAQLAALIPTENNDLRLQLSTAWNKQLIKLSDDSTDEMVADWIESLPAGPGHDIALTAMSKRLRPTNPDRATRLYNETIHPGETSAADGQSDHSSTNNIVPASARTAARDLPASLSRSGSADYRQAWTNLSRQPMERMDRFAIRKRLLEEWSDADVANALRFALGSPRDLQLADGIFSRHPLESWKILSTELAGLHGAVLRKQWITAVSHDHPDAALSLLGEMEPESQERTILELNFQARSPELRARLHERLRQIAKSPQQLEEWQKKIR